jgi:hypothetical protein
VEVISVLGFICLDGHVKSHLFFSLCTHFLFEDLLFLPFAVYDVPFSFIGEKNFFFINFGCALYAQCLSYPLV